MLDVSLCAAAHAGCQPLFLVQVSKVQGHAQQGCRSCKEAQISDGPIASMSPLLNAARDELGINSRCGFTAS